MPPPPFVQKRSAAYVHVKVYCVLRPDSAALISLCARQSVLQDSLRPSNVLKFERGVDNSALKYVLSVEN